MLKVVLFTWADEGRSGPAPGAEEESKNLTLSEDNIISFIKNVWVFYS